ncbi:uncharacterized protein KQ657_004997 [Scheffersomyces spartinae]|uniref:Uncharacterized protein n=1 Tax=Scheffersomyces spartinae TaxID=45513 RepID=A0A9P7VAL8_9ASCO|nr:uncharacterized protein KQ657_004997 [Scheffersomyces spartinae]KAG7194270.1 hypothetical protein KQ657_004997 [Scheffersomyces spartinae]
MGALELIILTAVMAGVTYGAGVIPLNWKVMELKLNYLSTFSMGMLMGTSVLLVIPEGVKSLYDAIADDSRDVAGSIIGFSLFLGFVLLYILDNFVTFANALGASQLSESWKPVIDVDIGSEVNSQQQQQYQQQPKNKLLTIAKLVFQESLTVGLLVHAGVDGISLGSTFASTTSSFKMVFFVALIIHKIPASFSLTTILARLGMPHNIIKIHLLLFALSTPFSGILSYLIIQIFRLTSGPYIGVLLLFSGGTFLYVVIHVIIEVSAPKEVAPPSSSHSEETLQQYHTHKTSLSGPEFICSLIGMLVPILLSFIKDE